MSLEQIEKAIKQLDEADQKKLLRDLPKLLKINSETFWWLKIAEPSFTFWDNKEDAVYGHLRT